MDIDFTNPENIVFLAIVLVLVIIVCSTLLLLFIKIWKGISSVFKRLFNIEDKKGKFRQASNNAQPSIDSLEGEINSERTMQRIMGGSLIQNSGSRKKKKKTDEDTDKSYAEKEKKSISDGLNRLKNSDGNKETLESKMPSRMEVQPEDDKYKEIKVSRAKRFPTDGAKPAGFAAARGRRTPVKKI